MKKDFLTIDPDTGGGNKNVNMNAQPNMSFKSRTTEIQFQGNGITKALPISQKGLLFNIDFSPFTEETMKFSISWSNENGLVTPKLNTGSVVGTPYKIGIGGIILKDHEITIEGAQLTTSPMYNTEYKEFFTMRGVSVKVGEEDKLKVYIDGEMVFTVRT